MAVHDWTRSPAGYFHHFHQRWTGAICDALNAGRLPEGVFALVAQYAGGSVPDVMALETNTPQGSGWRGGRGGIALATDPPQTRFVARATEAAAYAARANRVALHRGDEVIAVIEVVSPGNKGGASPLRQFVDKTIEMLERGIHVLVVDLFPPTPRDPNGIHQVIWEGMTGESFELPRDKPLTLAAYVAAGTTTAYVEPVAVDDVLPDMPIFIDPQSYVRVPLEEAYVATWAACPREFRDRVAAGS